MKLDRMIGILAILLQKEKVTAPYLAEKFEVSRRTINRDIEALCMAGIPLVTEPGQNGGVSIMDGYKIDRTLLTKSDMQAILAGLRSLDSVSGSNRYLQLMEKLSVGASNLLEGDSHILIDLSYDNKTEISTKMEMLHGAIHSVHKVYFSYFSQKGESKRTIEPYYLIFHWSSWYVWGWCESREDFRLFKLARMTDLQMGSQFIKRYVPIPHLSSEKLFPAMIQIKMVVQPEYQWRLVEECGSKNFVVQEDGTLLLTAGFTDKDSIIHWVISFGEGAELLEPVKLRQEILAYVEKIHKKYQES